MTQLSVVSSVKSREKPHKVSKKELTQSAQCSLDEGERIHYISEAAYFMALERGYCGGDPVQDWISAEAIIDCKH